VSQSEFHDADSASEHEAEEVEDTRDLSGYACHHCYTQGASSTS